MVKFSSLLEYRNYIDNLPLDFIVMELIRVKTASKKDLLRPAPLLGQDAINYSLEDLVGKISFKLFNYYQALLISRMIISSKRRDCIQGFNLILYLLS